MGRCVCACVYGWVGATGVARRRGRGEAQHCRRTLPAQPAAPATCPARLSARGPATTRPAPALTPPAAPLGTRPARLCSQGASKNVTYQEWDKIWSTNKRLIDPVCPRHTAVEAQARCGYAREACSPGSPCLPGCLLVGARPRPQAGLCGREHEATVRCHGRLHLHLPAAAVRPYAPPAAPPRPQPTCHAAALPILAWRRVPVTLSNGPAAPEYVEMPRHAKYPPAGTKQQMRSGSLWLDQTDAQVGAGGRGWGG